MAAKVHPQGPRPADLPAGDERREAEARAADTLAEVAEARNEDVGQIDPRAFKIENELAQYFNVLEVTDADPAYMYRWVPTHGQGQWIKRAQMERVPEGGGLALCWEVVQGDMVEAAELRGIGADTTRRLGDVILMRCRKDRYVKLQRLREARRAAMAAGSTTALEELGRQYRHRGVIIHTNLGEAMADGRGSLLRQQGLQMVTDMIREGNVPGLPQPGTR